MAMRDAWIEKRAAAMNGGTRNFSQMHYARKGVITEEMEYVAKREKLTPELVRDHFFCATPARQKGGNFWSGGNGSRYPHGRKILQKNGWTERLLGRVMPLRMSPSQKPRPHGSGKNLRAARADLIVRFRGPRWWASASGRRRSTRNSQAATPAGQTGARWMSGPRSNRLNAASLRKAALESFT